MPYDIPPWLIPQRMPGEALAQGVQAGSQIAHNFLQARQVAMQEEQQRRDAALMPLRQKMLDNQVKDAALDIKTKMDMQDDYLTNKQAFSRLAEAAKQISAQGAWAKPESEVAIWDIASKYPSVVATPQFKQVVQQFDVAGAAAIKARDAETRASKVEGELGLKSERIALQGDALRLKDEQAKAELASKEKMAGELNASRERIAGLKLASQKTDAAMDILPRAMLSKYKEEIHAIAEDPTTTAAEKSRKMDEALERLKEKRDSYETEKKGDDAVLMVDPSGKKYRIPKSNLEKAKQRGLKEYEG